MSGNNSGGMLVPLGIGAAGIVLYMAMKKKQASAETAPAEDPAASLPPPADKGPTATDQIEPTPAPSYAQAVAQTATDAAEEEEPEDPDSEEPEETQEEASDDAPASSSGGSSYTPYSPVSTINTGQQQTSSMQVIQITRNPARMVGNGKPGMRNTALLKKQQEFNRQRKGLQIHSDQAKKMQQSALNRKSVAYRPGALTVSSQSLVAKSTSALAPAAATQSSIFPLKFGMTGNPYVQELQRKIGIPATGHFNSQTRTALQRKYRVQEVSEALYKQIITGKAPMVQKKPIPRLLSKIKKILPKRKIVKRK